MWALLVRTNFIGIKRRYQRIDIKYIDNKQLNRIDCQFNHVLRKALPGFATSFVILGLQAPQNDISHHFLRDR
jgi:hypothetical protein